MARAEEGVRRMVAAGRGGRAASCETAMLAASMMEAPFAHRFRFPHARMPMSRSSPYDRDLDRNPANYTPLSPLSLIARTAYTYPQRLAAIHGDRCYTWAETYARSRRLGSALVRAGVRKGDTVAVMAANTPEMVELHFGVPMTGGVLNTLNTRLDAETIAFMLQHGEAKVLVTDLEFSAIVEKALALLGTKLTVVDIVDPQAPLGKR